MHLLTQSADESRSVNDSVYCTVQYVVFVCRMSLRAVGVEATLEDRGTLRRAGVRQGQGGGRDQGQDRTAQGTEELWTSGRWEIRIRRRSQERTHLEGSNEARQPSQPQTFSTEYLAPPCLQNQNTNDTNCVRTSQFASHSEKRRELYSVNQCEAATAGCGLWPRPDSPEDEKEKRSLSRRESFSAESGQQFTEP